MILSEESAEKLIIYYALAAFFEDEISSLNLNNMMDFVQVIFEAEIAVSEEKRSNKKQKKLT